MYTVNNTTCCSLPQKYVCYSHEAFGKRLFHYIAKHWNGKSSGVITPPTSPTRSAGKSKGGNDHSHLSKSAFLAGASHIISLLTDNAQMEFYIKVCTFCIYILFSCSCYPVVTVTVCIVLVSSPSFHYPIQNCILQYCYIFRLCIPIISFPGYIN